MTERAEVAETHISVVFAYGDRVLKIHKPVQFGFVDFSTLERRREDAEREVALNRRLAPDVYLGVASIDLDGDGPVEHGVLMRRLPADRNLEALVAGGRLAADQISQVAGSLAAFHRRAERSPAISAAATATALAERWTGTARALAPFIGRLVDRQGSRRLDELAERFVTGRGPLFERRIAEGRICDGHGDLQAADVFCLPDGPRLLDCLEFDDHLRYGDVVADLAFLAMDLERLGSTTAAGLLVERYRADADDPFASSLFHYYVAARAQVRLLVACLRATQSDGTAPTAARLLDLGLSHLELGRVRMVLVGGPPGSGKSSLAGAVARSLDAELLSTDHLRRETATVPPADRYRPAAREAVYRRLLTDAARHLGLGRSVVLDATWTSAALRKEARTVAAASVADLSELVCVVPPEVRMARVAARRSDGGGESEATPGVALRLAGEADPWPEATPVDAAGPLPTTVTAALVALGVEPA